MSKSREEQLAFLRSMQDEEIDFSDQPDIDGTENWRPNHLFYKPIKSKLNITLDKDVVYWLKKHKGKASNLINELLKKEMLKHV